MANAREKRRSEFGTGRKCARSALAQLGIDAVPIGQGSLGKPTWPTGYTGSIAHSNGLAVAVVASVEADRVSIGIDLEPSDALVEDLWPTVLLDAELAFCRGSRASCAVATTIFCIKEAIYKALYPTTSVYLDFLDVEVSLDQSGGRACAALTPSDESTLVRLPTLDLRYACESGLILAVATVTGQ